MRRDGGPHPHRADCAKQATQKKDQHSSAPSASSIGGGRCTIVMTHDCACAIRRTAVIAVSGRDSGSKCRFPCRQTGFARTFPPLRGLYAPFRAPPCRASNSFWSPNSKRRWAIERRVWRRAELMDRQVGNKAGATGASVGAAPACYLMVDLDSEDPSAGLHCGKISQKGTKRIICFPGHILLRRT